MKSASSDVGLLTRPTSRNPRRHKCGFTTSRQDRLCPYTNVGRILPVYITRLSFVSYTINRTKHSSHHRETYQRPPFLLMRSASSNREMMTLSGVSC